MSQQSDEEDGFAGDLFGVSPPKKPTLYKNPTRQKLNYMITLG